MLKNIDYQLEFRRFLSSQHLYTGIRITMGIIIPATILYHFGLLTAMISIPLGASFIGLTDLPGPFQHRRNGMIAGILLNFAIVLITGYSHPYPLLIGIEIIFFGIFLSLIGVYGLRASSLGLVALIVFILNVDSSFGSADIIQRAVNYVIGGVWYALLSLSLYSLRPYKPVQQLLGECLMKTGDYLLTRGLFYNRNSDPDSILPQLMDHQVRIHQYQEQLREMLFTTRRYMSESTHKGRILMMTFRDSIDLFERIMTSQQDYTLLHKEFDDAGILETFHEQIRELGYTLRNIGLSIQEGQSYTFSAGIESALEQSKEAFKKLRENKLDAGNVESFIRLRNILNSLQELTDRVKRIETYTTYDRSVAGQFKNDADFSKFATHQEINADLLRSNLSWSSANFRHALRLTIALLMGYLISLFFTFGHGYWILLTIATIIKPAYSLTKKRNIQRLSGTFAGAAIGFLVLYFSHDNTIMFVVMVAMMIVSYGLLRINYGLSIAGLTVFLLISFHFLNAQGLTIVLQDRIIDTVIGSAIAYIVSYFVLPAWEHEQIDAFINSSIRDNQKYFNAVATSFTDAAADPSSYKMSRKDAFVSLANLSDNFQRMLSDPKNQQPKLPLYHQFVSASHMLTSHIAALSSYAQQYGAVYAHSDFQPFIHLINKTFDETGKKALADAALPASEINEWPIIKKVQRLLDQRKKDLEKGLETTPDDTRKILSELSSVTDQFRLIYTLTADLVKILRQIRWASVSRPV
ncbi:MAG: FUSC family membrane protein [Flavitalea sp.]